MTQTETPTLLIPLLLSTKTEVSGEQNKRRLWAWKETSLGLLFNCVKICMHEILLGLTVGLLT